ncbi:DUF317 domain-containing protein [Streptomyces sp. RB6PN25]|uniref:DUF317 domain-containing protein n=1 Tax=Streptomyces humicola TaxID=2953240 RepID=A0ABT1PXL4_9ACTN|nr:DUF317 domain-containing protein [Streptomyces humicola]MCQ4081833.1 DUF317 domain-containing protein [Streptomyces humicola]
MHPRTDPSRPYLIAPRYLAGPSTRATGTLIDTLDRAGWTTTGCCDTTDTLWTSPDGLRFANLTTDGTRTLPGRGPEIAWELGARRTNDMNPLWSVSFTPDTPPEIITDVAATLADDNPPPTGPEHLPHYLAQPNDAQAVRQPLADAGWFRDIGEAETAWYSPCGQAVLVGPHGRNPDGNNWLATAREATSMNVLWLALATPLTPDTLITALCRALTNPQPVARTRIPGAHVGHVTVTRAT